MLKVCYVKTTTLAEIVEFAQDNSGPFYIYSQTGFEEDIIIFSEKQLSEEEITKIIDDFLAKDPKDLIKTEDEPIFDDGDDYTDDDLILLG